MILRPGFIHGTRRVGSVKIPLGLVGSPMQMVKVSSFCFCKPCNTVIFALIPNVKLFLRLNLKISLCTAGSPKCEAVDEIAAGWPTVDPSSECCLRGEGRCKSSNWSSVSSGYCWCVRHHAIQWPEVEVINITPDHTNSISEWISRCGWHVRLLRLFRFHRFLQLVGEPYLTDPCQSVVKMYIVNKSYHAHHVWLQSMICSRPCCIWSFLSGYILKHPSVLRYPF